MRPDTDALIVIDMQNDFCPGGALPVPGGDEITGHLNRLLEEFAITVMTQDWHPEGHASFASQHPGKAPFDTATLSYGAQTLWPDHCVIGSKGAQIHPRINTDHADMIIRKGFRPGTDSYSAFFENDHATQTGLHGYLQDRGATAVTLVGLAFDYCVLWTALDAVKLGYEVTVIEAATRAIAPDTAEAARESLIDAGVRLVRAHG